MLFGLLALIEFEVARPVIRPLFKKAFSCCFSKNKKRSMTSISTEESEGPDNDVMVN